MKLVVPVFVSLLAGLLLGAIPFVNHHLHWNFFVILPVSGLILGGGFGWLQFQTARLVHARIGVVAGLVLTFVGGLSYLATDVGVWATETVTTDSGQSVPLREVVPVTDFIGARLLHSSISGRGHTLQVGTTGTVLTFIADELGAMLATASVLFALALGQTYCRRCSRYRKKLNQVEREYPLDPAQSDAHWQAFQQLAQASQYSEFAARVQGMPPPTIASRRKLVAQEFACPKCGQTAIALSLHRQEKDGWSSDGRQLCIESAGNEGARLSG